MRFFQLATHFGDAALLVPVSLVAIGVLVWGGHRAAALRFAVAVASLMAATVALKVGFYATGGDATLDILSPSGHAGFSVTVYTCCAAVLAKQLRPLGAIAVVAAVVALLVTILVSRIVLGAHTPAEVVMGCAVGLLCASTFLFWNPDLSRMRLRLPVFAMVLLAAGTVSAWVGAHRFNTERHIEHVGILVGSSLGTLLPSDFRPGYGFTIRQGSHDGG